MSLVQIIETDFIQAFKAKNEIEVAVLRMLKSAFKNKAIELKKSEIEDSEAIGVLKNEIKKRKESIEAFIAGGRSELADKEKQELAILEKYLPKQLDVTAVLEKVKIIQSQLLEEDRNNFGKLMKAVMVELKGIADGQTVSQAVKQILGQK